MLFKFLEEPSLPSFIEQILICEHIKFFGAFER